MLLQGHLRLQKTERSRWATTDRVRLALLMTRSRGVVHANGGPAPTTDAPVASAEDGVGHSACKKRNVRAGLPIGFALRY
jgi:hypothetical protein